MSNDSKFNDMNKLAETTNSMKPARFWGAWLVALIMAIGFTPPHVITLLKWLAEG